MLEQERSLQTWSFRDNGSVARQVTEALIPVLLESASGNYGVYGSDQFTSKTVKLFRDLLHPNSEVYFTNTGTVGNIIGASISRIPLHYLLSSCSHMICMESGGPLNAGVQLFSVQERGGKLQFDDIVQEVERNPQITGIHLTQTTEFGTVYTLQELRQIGKFCRGKGLLFGMDGARIAHASLRLNCSWKEMLCDTGVDYVVTGVAKIGGKNGNALVILNREKTAEKGILLLEQREIFDLIKARGTQSNLWEIACQFDSLLRMDFWKKYVMRAMFEAQKTALALVTAGFQPAFPVETNALYIRATDGAKARLQSQGWNFFSWPSDPELIRFMFGFNTPRHLHGLLAEALLILRKDGLLPQH